MTAHIIPFPQTRRTGWIRRKGAQLAKMYEPERERALTLQRTRDGLIRHGVALEIAVAEAQRLERALLLAEFGVRTEQIAAENKRTKAEREPPKPCLG